MIELGWQDGFVLLANKFGIPKNKFWLTVVFGSELYWTMSVNPEEVRLIKENRAKKARPPAATDNVKKRYG